MRRGEVKQVARVRDQGLHRRTPLMEATKARNIGNSIPISSIILIGVTRRSRVGITGLIGRKQLRIPTIDNRNSFLLSIILPDRG